MRLPTLFAIVVVMFAMPAIAAESLPVVPQPRAVPARVTKVYSVDDLVMPGAALKGDEATAAYRKNTENLVKLVTGMVRPYSWAECGGKGTAEYFDIGCALVIQNTPDVLQEVADLLEALRRLAPTSVCYEVRVLKVPAGFCERAGVKLSRDTTLTDAQLRSLLEAAQGHCDATVMQFPKLTALDGKTATAKVGEDRSFVTGFEATKMKGQTVFIPKSNPVYIGDTLTVQGRVSADGNYVHVQAGLAHTGLTGNVELAPVVTFITPIFEGGATGQPVPFTQYLQVPNLQKEHVEKAAVVPVGGTLVVGAWKEIEESKGKKPGKEFEVVVLATVRTAKEPPVAEASAFAQPPRDKGVVYKLRNVAAADAAHAVETFLKSKKLSAVVTAEPVSNTVLVNTEPCLHKQIIDILAALDQEPKQVIVQAVVLEVPRGFVTQAGLNVGGKPGATAWTLSAREAHMLTEMIRGAKGRGECDILSRPQLCVCDNQTGFAQVGQQFPVPAGNEVKLAGGTAEPKVEYVHLGVTLRMTPRVAPDGKSVLLRTNAESTSLGRTVQLADGVSSQVLNTESLEATTAVAFGDTLVLAMSPKANTDHSIMGVVRYLCGQQTQTLVIITPHLTRSEPVVRPAGWFTK